MPTIEGYSEEQFTHDSHTLRLFRKGEGSGVVLMHELPGLTRETVEFSDWIADNGFHVVLPLLFGSPLQSARFGLLKAPAVCIQREFNSLRGGKASPITSALRALCAKVHAEQGGRGVGAIGMCFTGGFVLTMMLEPSVLAPVIAQPSLPLLDPAGLDIDDESLARVVRRSDTVPLLGLRFERDGISSRRRRERLMACFNGRPNFDLVEVPGKGHSTLTFDYGEACARGTDTRRRVLEFLKVRLLVGSDGEP